MPREDEGASSGSVALASEGLPRKPHPTWFKPGNNMQEGARPRQKGLAKLIRERNPPEKIIAALEEIAFTPGAKRDRMDAIKYLVERGYGKIPDTHLFGAMNEEATEAASELTKDQLLGLLDGGTAVRAAVVDGEVTAVTETTVHPSGSGPADNDANPADPED